MKTAPAPVAIHTASLATLLLQSLRSDPVRTLQAAQTALATYRKEARASGDLGSFRALTAAMWALRTATHALRLTRDDYQVAA